MLAKHLKGKATFYWQILAFLRITSDTHTNEMIQRNKNTCLIQCFMEPRG